jgi:transposase-like protein
MTGRKKREKRRNRYPNELKRKIAKEYLSGSASYGILAEENGLRDKSVVKEFVKWYKRQLASDGPEVSNLSKETNQGFNKDMSKTKEKEKDEVRLLRKRLAEEQLKNELLETMIDIAEEELKIDIRKKSGTKQSEK